MVTMPIKEAAKKYPDLYEFLPVDLIDCPDYMCSVYYSKGKRHFSIFDRRDPFSFHHFD